MTDPIFQLNESKPEAIIQYDKDALRFLVNGVEVFRLTETGMEYKGQTVEDAGVAYREVMAFFDQAKQFMPYGHH